MGGGMACFVRYDVEHDFRRAMEMAGFMVKGQIIWDKVVHGMGDLKGAFAPCHENVIFATGFVPVELMLIIVGYASPDATKLWITHPTI